MGLSPWTNFGKGVITVAPSPATSGLSFAMSEADAALFPDPDTDGAFNVVVFPAIGQPSVDNAEVVKVTASAAPSGGNVVFTIVRAQEDSTAREIVVGDRVYFGVTKGVLETIMDALAIDVDLANPLQGVSNDPLLAGNSQVEVPTEYAVKAYADLQGNSMARQAIINGNFDVWQRGTSVTNPANATLKADRFKILQVLDGGTNPTNVIHSRQALTPGDLPNSFFHYRIAPDGAGTSFGANSGQGIYQIIENGTRNLCGDGKKVTVSFYAKASVASKRIGVYLYQNYGSGGSPSATENITGSVVTLTSSWAKYTFTFTTNTLTGKTFGTAFDDALAVRFMTQWGTGTYGGYLGGATAESWGGSGTIDIAQVQLCAGDVALPFMPKSFDEELRACQRYYEKTLPYSIVPGTSGSSYGWIQYQTRTALTASTAGVLSPGQVKFMVAKRNTPNITLYDGNNGSANGIRNGGSGAIRTGCTAGFIDEFGFSVINVDNSDSDDFAVDSIIQFHYIAEAEL